MLRKIVSGIVFWAGIAVIGAVAIPLVILFGMFLLIGKALDFILRKLGAL